MEFGNRLIVQSYTSLKSKSSWEYADGRDKRSTSPSTFSFHHPLLHSSILYENGSDGFPGSLDPEEMQVVRFIPPKPICKYHTNSCN